MLIGPPMTMALGDFAAEMADVSRESPEAAAARYPAAAEYIGALVQARCTTTIETRVLEERINELEASLRAELPHLRRIYVEPGFDERRPAPASK